MRTFGEQAEAIERYTEAVRRVAPDLVRQQAQTGTALLQERSIQEGITADGNKPSYSTQPVYRSSFAGKALNESGRKWAKGTPGAKGTWGEFRAAQGREGKTVNLFYTGHMWGSLRVVDGPSTDNEISAYVAPSDVESARKLAGNLKRYGDFMQHTPDERDRLRADTNNELTDLARRLL